MYTTFFTYLNQYEQRQDRRARRPRPWTFLDEINDAIDSIRQYRRRGRHPPYPGEDVQGRV